MKHRKGNSCKCYECYWYRTPEPGGKCLYDGFCTHKKKPIGAHVLANNECYSWEDAEARLTHYEVMTGKAESFRTESEREYIEDLLRREDA